MKWIPGAVLLSLAALAGAACTQERGPVVINDNVVTIENQTRWEWREVVVTVNDHFRASARTLAPGGLLTAPLGQFQTAFGQRFDAHRQSVATVVVAAKDSRGEAVALRWDRRKP